MDLTLQAQYSWIVGQDRTRDTPGASPSCSTGNPGRPLLMGANPTGATAFRPDPGAAQDYTTPVTYHGAKVWNGSGQINNRIPSPLQLTPGTGGAFSTTTPPLSTDGQQLLWVVMEWAGGTPNGGLTIEVFLE